MSKDKVFTNWDDTHSLLWGHQPIELAHQVHNSPLFSADTLAELIERYIRASTTVWCRPALADRAASGARAKSAVSVAVR